MTVNYHNIHISWLSKNYRDHIKSPITAHDSVQQKLGGQSPVYMITVMLDTPVYMFTVMLDSPV